MCTFMSTADLPSISKTGTSNKKFISLFMKPNKEGEKYRVRLLWYKQSSKNDRDRAYFCQSVHDHWGSTDKGTKIVDDVVVCPGTKYVHYDDEKFILNEKTGKKELNCPICRKATENKIVWKNSGFKDKISMQKYNALKAKFRGVIPVYVVNDPNNPKNNGQLKVLILTNKEEFEEFDKIVEAEKTKAYLSGKNGKPYEIFNGSNALDFYFRMDVIDEIKNQGKPNEFIRKVRKVIPLGFGKQAYSIPSITKEAIDDFGMDEQFYVSNTKEELLDFYHRHYGQDDVIVPDDDVDFQETTKVETPESTPVIVENKNITPTDDEMNSDVDDLLDDTPPIETSNSQENRVETDKAIKTDTVPSTQKDEIDSILDEIGDI